MNEKSVAVTRVFEASRERVFECWTRAEHLQHWFGPKGFTIHSCETDARPGGIFKLCLRAPDGEEHFVRGEFREVAAPAHLVISCVLDDDKGVQQLQEVIDVTFSESRGRTTVTVNAIARAAREAGPSDEAAAMLKGMDKGWAQTVDRLATHLRRK